MAKHTDQASTAGSPPSPRVRASSGKFPTEYTTTSVASDWIAQVAVEGYISYDRKGGPRCNRPR